MAEKKARRQEKHKSESRSETKGDNLQVLITIDPTKGDFVKIQKLDKSGRHHDLTTSELADLTGDDEVADLEEALETAYEAGLKDALDNEVNDEKLLARGVRRLVLRRALSRSALKRRPRPGTNGNGVHEAG